MKAAVSGIHDQIKRAFRSSLIRIVNQSITQCEIKVDAAVDRGGAVDSDPSFKSQQQVLRRVLFTPLPVLWYSDLGFHQDLR